MIPLVLILQNPNGIPYNSPGLRLCRYPGNTITLTMLYPEGVASVNYFIHTKSWFFLIQPRWGWFLMGRILSQGSGLRRNLGLLYRIPLGFGGVYQINGSTQYDSQLDSSLMCFFVWELLRMSIIWCSDVRAFKSKCNAPMSVHSNHNKIVSRCGLS